MFNKILVVDDEESVRDAMQALFEDCGFAVTVAESAEKALEVLRTDTIQIMFFDLMMPGMSGVDLCKEIRATNPIACIFAMTGYRGLFDLVKCRSAGFDDYFQKPVPLDLLIETAKAAEARLKRWTGQ